MRRSPIIVCESESLSTLGHICESEGWIKVVPFEDDARENRRGLISESHAPCLFEGQMRKNEDGSRTLEGLFQRANTRNKNGRIYPFHILERETSKLAAIIKENNGILGELDHPETVNVNMKFTCLRLDRLSMNKDGITEGRMSLLPDLPMGKAAIGCCDALGGKPGVSSRGAGSLFTKGDATMVGEDYSMKTYDMVHDPSTPGARPAVVQEALIREFVEFSKARPSTQRLALGSLVDRWLGLK
jgi:hypothetical protein